MANSGHSAYRLKLQVLHLESSVWLWIFSDMHYYPVLHSSLMRRSAPTSKSYIWLSFCLRRISDIFSGEEYVTLMPESVCSSTTFLSFLADVISFVLHYPFRQLVPFFTSSCCLYPIKSSTSLRGNALWLSRSQWRKHHFVHLRAFVSGGTGTRYDLCRGLYHGQKDRQADAWIGICLTLREKGLLRK